MTQNFESLQNTTERPVLIYNNIMKSFNRIVLPIVLIYFILLQSAFSAAGQNAGGPPGNDYFKPGAAWFDNRGELINAHGGGLLFQNGLYYWYGESRGKSASQGVSVYSSANLYQWKYEGVALALSADTNNPITKGCIMERPKVIYNKKTGKYVMWFHLELKGQGYKAARAGVAVSDKITGPYTFLESFRPNGNMSRDMSLFVDDDGAAYHIYASRENYDLRISRLTTDFLQPTTTDSLLLNTHREAPAVFKVKEDYFLITSGCTGWAPNRASLHVAKSLTGPWKFIGDPMEGPGADTTFGGQSTFVVPVQGLKNAFIFMADRWNPKNIGESRYIWLPVQFKNNLPYIQWLDQWNLDVFNTGR